MIVPTTRQTSLGQEVERIFLDAVEKLTEDMPLIQHGSGDVATPLYETSKLLATCTAQYIFRLVDAALDAQQLMCDTTQLTVLPPPPVAPQRVNTSSSSSSATSYANSVAATTNPRVRRRSAHEDFWNEPVVPKIKKDRPSHHNGMDNEAINNNNHSRTSRMTNDDNNNDYVDIDCDDWVGVVGVDLLETSRSRSAYVRGPHAALSAQCFIFPVCHDTYAYNRAVEIQASRRNLESVLMDPVVTEMVRTEGRPVKKKEVKDKKKKVMHRDVDGDDDDEDGSEVEQDNDGDESEEADEGPMWPVLDSILPVHRDKYTVLLSGKVDDNEW